MTGSTAFQPVLQDPLYATTEKRGPVERVIFCSGQVFTLLQTHRQEHNITNTAIIRVEEIYPFPRDHVQRILEQFATAKDVVWCQEEPYNGGAWYYMRDRLERILSGDGGEGDRKLRYAGRVSAAAVATGSKKVHAKEEAKFIAEAFREHY